MSDETKKIDDPFVRRVADACQWIAQSDCPPDVLATLSLGLAAAISANNIDEEETRKKHKAIISETAEAIGAGIMLARVWRARTGDSAVAVSTIEEAVLHHVAATGEPFIHPPKLKGEE